MNDKTAELIEKLATKFGTTTEHLWGVLIRQAPITATCDLGTLIAFSVLLWVLIYCAREAWRKFLSDDNDIDAIRSMIFTFLAVGVLLITSVWLADLDEIIAGFFNPEYWALKQIIK